MKIKPTPNRVKRLIKEESQDMGLAKINPNGKLKLPNSGKQPKKIKQKKGGPMPTVIEEKIITSKMTVPEKADANIFAERVEKKAFELYQKRGCQDGHDCDDWLEAEKLVEDEMIAEK
ncbi:MAG: DUF2934 domain-containing protein [Candidatus Omnitrophica bacterium]|nr:DUF2934 domain-containing protein [Candidatus Omnitrophota bacterium]